MKESLTGRVARIISGSFNALIGAVENAVPETVMEQAIREIDEVTDDVRMELGKIVANKHLATTRMMEQKQKHKELDDQIAVAVSEKRDDLAQAAISRQLDLEAQIPILEASISEYTAKEKELEGFISGMKAKKREMADDLRRFRESQKKMPVSDKDASVPGGSGSSVSVDGRIAKAESAFDRIMEKATGIPGNTASENSKSIAQMAELEDLTRKNRIQERLAAIKGRLDKE